MARSPILIFSVVVFLFFVSNCVASGLLGGRTKIKHVKRNKEVQALGSYSVDEYNKLQRSQKGGSARRDLKFSKVMKAESQLVSGTKYYLKIATVSKSGVLKVFNAELVVIPWMHSKQLLSFKPARK